MTLQPRPSFLKVSPLIYKVKTLQDDLEMIHQMMVDDDIEMDEDEYQDEVEEINKEILRLKKLIVINELKT